MSLHWAEALAVGVSGSLVTGLLGGQRQARQRAKHPGVVCLHGKTIRAAADLTQQPGRRVRYSSAWMRQWDRILSNG